MAFPRKLLHDSEDVVLDLRPHWWYLAGPSAALVAALVVLAALAVSELHDYLQLAGAALVLVALARFVHRYARWATTNVVVTTDRLIFRSGVLAKRGIEIPLERVNTVFFQQTLFERLLRCGDLVIESAGERGQQHFSNIARPSVVQQEIYRQIEGNQARMMGWRGSPSLGEQLEHLHSLHQRGVLTEAEFETKKAQLLERM